MLHQKEKNILAALLKTALSKRAEQNQLLAKKELPGIATSGGEDKQQDLSLTAPIIAKDNLAKPQPALNMPGEKNYSASSAPERNRNTSAPVKEQAQKFTSIPKGNIPAPFSKMARNTGIVDNSGNNYINSEDTELLGKLGYVVSDYLGLEKTSEVLDLYSYIEKEAGVPRVVSKAVDKNESFSGEFLKDMGYKLPEGYEVKGDLCCPVEKTEQSFQQTEKAEKQPAEKPGLWANIHAKRKRGEKPVEPGDENYPDKKQWDKLSKEGAADPGQSILISGHSGAGKSTLAKELSKLLDMNLRRVDAHKGFSDYVKKDHEHWEKSLSAGTKEYERFNKIINNANRHVLRNAPEASIIEGTQLGHLSPEELSKFKAHILVGGTPEQSIMQRIARSAKKKGVIFSPEEILEKQMKARAVVDFWEPGIEKFRKLPEVINYNHTEHQIEPLISRLQKVLTKKAAGVHSVAVSRGSQNTPPDVTADNLFGNVPTADPETAGINKIKDKLISDKVKGTLIGTLPVSIMGKKLLGGGVSAFSNLSDMSQAAQRWKSGDKRPAIVQGIGATADTLATPIALTGVGAPVAGLLKGVSMGMAGALAKHDARVDVARDLKARREFLKNRTNQSPQETTGLISSPPPQNQIATQPQVNQKQGSLWELLKKAKGRCWEGYEPVPGKEPYSEDSCRPKTEKKKPVEKTLQKEAMNLSYMFSNLSDMSQIGDFLKKRFGKAKDHVKENLGELFKSKEQDRIARENADCEQEAKLIEEEEKEKLLPPAVPMQINKPVYGGLASYENDPANTVHDPTYYNDRGYTYRTTPGNMLRQIYGDKYQEQLDSAQNYNRKNNIPAMVDLNANRKVDVTVSGRTGRYAGNRMIPTSAQPLGTNVYINNRQLQNFKNDDAFSGFAPLNNGNATQAPNNNNRVALPPGAAYEHEMSHMLYPHVQLVDDDYKYSYPSANRTVVWGMPMPTQVDPQDPKNSYFGSLPEERVTGVASLQRDNFNRTGSRFNTPDQFKQHVQGVLNSGNIENTLKGSRPDTLRYFRNIAPTPEPHRTNLINQDAFKAPGIVNHTPNVEMNKQSALNFYLQKVAGYGFSEEEALRFVKLAEESANAEEVVPGKGKLKRRFKYWLNKLKNKGVFAGTYHKRIAIPKGRLPEKHLEHLGFEPVLIAVPEAGQDQFSSFRHPDNLFHLHSHGDHWTMHKDNHPSLTMALRKAGPSEIPYAIASGAAHIVTEGIPGIYKYVANRLAGSGNMLDAVLNKKDK